MNLLCRRWADFLDRPVKDIKKLLSLTVPVDSIDGLFDDSNRPMVEVIAAEGEETIEQRCANSELHESVGQWLDKLEEKQRIVLDVAMVCAAMSHKPWKK